jgi:hypothetical protein
MIKKIFSLLLIFTGIAVINSCTKLEEDVLDEGSVAGLTDKQQAEGIIAPVYAKLEDIFMHTTYFALQEISTDEAILPFRGGTDWGDNGIYVQLHKHEKHKFRCKCQEYLESYFNRNIQGGYCFEFIAY